MFDLISIGDCVLDTYIPLMDADVELHHRKKKLELNYGAKNPVGPSMTMLGGNAANNAVGSSRLNLKVAIYTNIGNDSDAKKIKVQFKEEDVDTRYVVESKEFPSSHHIILDYKGERTILSYHQPWKYDLPDIERSKWVYLTSLSPSYTESSIIDQVINYTERMNAKLVFNPGTYQLRQGMKKNARLLALAELIIMNVEEAKVFLGHDAGSTISIKKLLHDLYDLGPRAIVITDGGEGSYGFDGEKCWQLPIFPANLVEMTGAGDAYATGTMAGLFHGEPLNKAMRWGAANGASVVEHMGAQEGLLSVPKIELRLKENNRIIAKEI